MTSRERLLAVLNGKIPDHVPVTPDVSNMVPAKLTGKPFWDIYLYQDPPLWKAYTDCVKYFGFDGMHTCPLDGFIDSAPINPDRKTVIVFQDEERLVTQDYELINGKRKWSEGVNVYFAASPPNWWIDPHAIRLPKEPDKFEPIGEIKQWSKGEELLKLLKDDLGEHGIVGLSCGTSKLLHSEQDIYDYYDDPQKFYDKRDMMLKNYDKRFDNILSLEHKPDYINTGGSGTLIHQTPQIFRELGLPIIKKMTALAKQHGFPSQLHSCGPEKELVKILVEETDLTCVDPLEIPPMGDCDLKELKKLYGHKIVLKGNLHTTNIMLHGTVADVVEASKRAIDDAAEGGGFILSTGDQCGRDTPDENLFAMIETAKTYGKY